MVLMQKVWISNIKETYFQSSKQSVFKKEHLDSFRQNCQFGLLVFLVLLQNALPQVTMGYHTRFCICYHTFIKIFASFLSVTIFSI